MACAKPRPDGLRWHRAAEWYCRAFDSRLGPAAIDADAEEPADCRRREEVTNCCGTYRVGRLTRGWVRLRWSPVRLAPPLTPVVSATVAPACQGFATRLLSGAKLTPPPARALRDHVSL